MSYITPGQIKQLIERADADQISREDLTAFLNDPDRWREGVALMMIKEDREQERASMQEVYDSVGIKCTIPPLPSLTCDQKKALRRFRFTTMYLPAINEKEYPEDFPKIWTPTDMERRPFTGCWVAMESIWKPNFDSSDVYGGIRYENNKLISSDPLADSLGIVSRGRFNWTWEEAHDVLQPLVAGLTTFPRKTVRFPTFDEWRFALKMIAKATSAGDSLRTESFEWTDNECANSFRWAVGGRGGYTSRRVEKGEAHPDIGFRILIEL
jgi:hypothetical protein